MTRLPPCALCGESLVRAERARAEAAEREACAQTIEEADWYTAWGHNGTADLARRIRARGRR